VRGFIGFVADWERSWDEGRSSELVYGPGITKEIKSEETVILCEAIYTSILRLSHNVRK
jgi:hypothetical protein